MLAQQEESQKILLRRTLSVIVDRLIVVQKNVKQTTIE
jgi:hypothetical protein